MEERKNQEALVPESTESPKRRFPTIGDLLAMLGIVLGVQIVVGLLLSLVAGFAGAGPEQLLHDGRYLCLTFLASMSLALTGVLLYRRRRGGTGRIVSFSTRRLHPMLLLWSFVLIFAVGIVIEPLLDLLPDLTPDLGRGFWTILMTVVFAPLFEELLCRGVVLGSIRQRYGVIAAWLGSAAFFGILHLNPVQVVNAFILGLILGYIYLATESIWAPVILHALNNTVAYVMLATAGDLLFIDLIGSRTLYGAVYIVALAVAGLSAYKIWESLRRMKAAEKIDAGA